MLKSLLLRSEPISQLAATDPLESQTWCSLRIQVGSRSVSRLWDKSLESERDALDVPAFPIAEWLIKNWWSLFNELCPVNSVHEHPSIDASWLSWTRRHCLRAADSSLLLPKFYLYANGESLVAESHSDKPGSLPNMPGEFLNDGVELIDTNIADMALTQFITHTLNRVQGVESDRMSRAVGHWHAIQNADAQETEFCKLAGRMGLDPYDPDDLSESLASFFEAILADADQSLVRDLTEAAKPELVQVQWKWVQDASQEFRLGPRSVELPFGLPAGRYSPAEYGYKLACQVRTSVGQENSPIESIEKTASEALGRTFQVQHKNHLVGREIKAIVGQTDTGGFVAAGPSRGRPSTQRFMNARSLFHVLGTSQSSRRLVTDAYSTDQQASRAFAAELLAPRNALLNRLSKSVADPEAVQDLSKEFEVSTRVIELQLENAGVPLSSD